MQSRPDIVIFNPDQWRGGLLGHAGDPAAVTPQLDALVATDAVSFTNAYCQNPVCTPSRCSFMTGWYPHVRGHRTMFHMLHPEHGEPNLLRILKEQGYYVWWGGKNDLTPAQDPLEPYCDVRFRPSADDYRRWGYEPREGNHGGDLAWRGERGSDTYWSFYKGRLEKGGADLYCDGDWQMVLGALDFIRGYRGERPFCLYLPLTYPHPPYCVEEPWFSLIDRGALPPRRRWTGSGKPAILGAIREGQGLAGWSEARWTELRACYYGMCSRLDHQLGLVVDELRRRGSYDSTALFVFSDHGDYTGDYDVVEKTQNTFEDPLVRVPLVVKPPAFCPVLPGVRDALVELVDFSATVYDLLGLDPGYDSFGRSLLPLLAGRGAAHRDAVFCEGGRRYGERQAMELESLEGLQDPALGLYSPRLLLQCSDAGPWHGKAVMCRTRTHKYVLRLYEPDELYDLAADPAEEHNRADDPRFAALLAELRARTLRWLVETADVVPRGADRR